MIWRDAPLYVETHDLARWVSERAEGWAERGHPALAAKAIGESCAILDAVALALTFPATRPSDLEQADRSIVRLRVLLRLAKDLGCLSAGGLRFACGRLQATGRMIGGWRKRIEHNAAGGQGLPTAEVSGDGPPAATGV